MGYGEGTGDYPCLLTAKEAGQYLGLHEETIRRLAREKKIPSYKIGGVWRFDKAALQRWTEVHRPGLRHKTVLAVDDEEAIRDLIRRTLEPEGFVVRTACDGKEALADVRQHVPDVVLLDLRLPNIKGPDFLKALHEQHGQIPVIIITGYPDGELMAQALRYSPIMMLAKPVKPKEILSTVELVLGLRIGQPQV